MEVLRIVGRTSKGVLLVGLIELCRWYFLCFEKKTVSLDIFKGHGMSTETRLLILCRSNFLYEE